MRILTTAIVLAAAAAASSTAAFAADRLSDGQFIKASYCRGLIADDAAAANLDALLKANKRGRMDFIVDRASSARDDGARHLRKAAGEGGKAEIARELAGPCAVYTG